MMDGSGKSAHSTLDKLDLYNTENVGESPTVASSVKMYYDEIEHYDFSNPGQNSFSQGKEIVGKLFLFIYKGQLSFCTKCFLLRNVQHFLTFPDHNHINDLPYKGHFVSMIWKNQKKMGVGCGKGKNGNVRSLLSFLTIMKSIEEQPNDDRNNMFFLRPLSPPK